MEPKEVFDLTAPQKSIWYTEQVFKNTSVNTICATVKIYENVDTVLLKKAINSVIEHNDSFRLHIILQDNNVKQYISRYKPFDIEVISISNENELQRIEEMQAHRIFNIIDSDLFHFKIVTLKNKFSAIISSVNHMIADSWSLGLSTQECIKTYNCLVKNEVPVFENNSYKDLINAEAEYSKNIKHEKDCAYWKNVFNSIPEQATIPSLLHNTNKLSNKAHRLSFEVEKNIVEKINSFCADNHFSVFNFLMSVYSLYISKVSNSNDFVIGTPILNRTTFKEKHTTGMFVNTVPIRVQSSNDCTFKDFVNSSSKQMREILRHQKYSYNSILEDIRTQNAHIPNLYNILISYQITKIFNEDLGNYKTSWIFNGYCPTDINISISDINDTGNLFIDYDYLINKYEPKNIKTFHSHIVSIINQILENTNIPLSEIKIITEEEKELIINKFNNTFKPLPKNKTIVHLFEEQVKKAPNSIAIQDYYGNNLTYKEFDKKTNQLARFLRKKGISRNDLVCIVANRSIEMLIGIFGIIKSGAGYVPIDPNFPEDRKKYILEDCAPKIVLLADADIDTNITKIDLCKDTFNLEDGSPLQIINTPEDIVYCIYTSGTTGKPKGVLNKHIGLLNRILWMNDRYPIKSGDVILQKTTYCFDVSVWELIWWSLFGAKLVLLKVKR